MKPVCLFLVLGISVIRSEETDFNQLVDENISRIGNMLRYVPTFSRGFDVSGFTIPDEKCSFPRVIILGLDKVQRTGDCKITKEGRHLNYEFNFGSSFLVFVIPELRYHDEDMSAVLRVRNNSFYISFSQIKGLRNVTVNEMNIKSFGKVEVLSSSPRYDGGDVEGVFEKLRKMANDFINIDIALLNGMTAEMWDHFSSKYPKGLFNEL